MANDTNTVRNTEIGTGASGIDGPKTSADQLGKITGKDGVGPGTAGGDTLHDAGDGAGGLAGGKGTYAGGKGNNASSESGRFEAVGGTGAGGGGVGRARGGDATTAGQAGGIGEARGGDGSGAGAGGVGRTIGGNSAGGLGGVGDVDAGTGTTNGDVTVGTTNAERVSIGRNNKSTILLGKLEAPQFAMALANGANNDVNTTTIGRIYYRIDATPTPSAAFSITGFNNPSDGRVLIVQNATTQQWTIANENAGSAVANRIRTQSGSDIVLNGHASAIFIYSSADARWILIAVQEADAAASDLLQWAATGNPNSAAANRYLNQWAALGSVLTTTPPSLVGRILIPGPTGKVRTLRNARAEITTAPGADPGLTFTLQKNGVDTAITFTIINAALVGSDLVNTVTCVPGDYLTVRHTRAGSTSNPGNMNFSVELI